MLYYIIMIVRVFSHWHWDGVIEKSAVLSLFMPQETHIESAKLITREFYSLY